MMVGRRYKSRGIERVKNPTGRLDWLAGKLVERLVERSEHPVLKALHQEFRADLEALLTRYVGPHNREARTLTRSIRALANGRAA